MSEATASGAQDASVEADAKALFEEVVALPHGPARTRRVEAAAGERPLVAARVRALLAAHEQAGAFLASPTIDPAVEAPMNPFGEDVGSADDPAERWTPGAAAD